MNLKGIGQRIYNLLLNEDPASLETYIKHSDEMQELACLFDKKIKESKTLNTLLNHNHNNFVNDTNVENLVALFAVLEAYDLDATKVNFFEFGSHHYEFPKPNRTAYNSSLGFFFSELAEQGLIKYRCFDSGFTNEQLNFSAADHISRNPSSEDTVKKAIQAVKKANINSFKEAQQLITKSISDGIVPVIFSHTTLNDPKLNKEQAFWLIKGGLQIHTGDEYELQKNSPWQEPQSYRIITAPNHINFEEKHLLKLSPLNEPIDTMHHIIRHLKYNSIFVWPPPSILSEQFCTATRKTA